MDLSSAIVGWVLGILNKATGPFLVEKLGATCKTLKILGNAGSLPEPGQLAELIRKGEVRPGEYVLGEGIFSLHTLGPGTVQPAIALQIGSGDTAITMLDAISALWMNPGAHISANVPLPQAPISQFFSSTRYPIFNDDTRIGFLYPKEMNGFALPMTYTGTPLFMRQETCAVRQSELREIENVVVEYRAIVREIPRSAFDAHFSGITDEGYEQARKLGLLRFLSFIEDGTYIRRKGGIASGVFYSGYFVRTHWSASKAGAFEGFADALDEALQEACKQVDLPRPRRIHHTQDDGVFHRWTGHGLLVVNPDALPCLDLQVITDLNSVASTEDRRRFEKMKSVIIERLNQQFTREARAQDDVDGINDFRPEEHTVLQSDAATSITHPIAVGVRGWLEKRKKG